MKIEGKMNCVCSFDELHNGDVFVPDDDKEELYMKTDSEDFDCNQVKVNSVHLENGELFEFDENYKVHPIKGKFVIER